MDENEDNIKSPIKRYGSTRKIYLFNSKYKALLSTLSLPMTSRTWKCKGKREKHFRLIGNQPQNVFSWEDNISYSCRAHSGCKSPVRIRTGGCGGEASVEVDEDIKSRDKNAVEGIYDVVTLFVYFFISNATREEASGYWLIDPACTKLW